MIIDLHRLEVFSLCIRISFKVVFKTIFLNFFQKFSYSRLQINCEILESEKNQIQHFLYFLPLPHGQGSFRPTFASSRINVLGGVFADPGTGGRAESFLL